MSEHIGTGKWAEPGVPHRGWTCVHIEDLGEPAAICEMCEVMCIRYVHTMQHPDYEPLHVGCVCAGNMEQNLVGARRREAEFKKRHSRRSRWLIRTWRTSSAGNDYLNADGFNVVVYPKDRGWGARVKHRDSGRERVSRLPYATPEHAKLAAFDAMLNMKQRRAT